jgi:hypothetical protein
MESADRGHDQRSRLASGHRGQGDENHAADDVKPEPGDLGKKIAGEDGQLGDQRTMVENMRNGTLEVTWVTVGFFGSYEPILNVIESGYLFRDSQHSYKVFDGPMGEEIVIG